MHGTLTPPRFSKKRGKNQKHREDLTIVVARETTPILRFIYLLELLRVSHAKKVDQSVLCALYVL